MSLGTEGRNKILHNFFFSFFFSSQIELPNLNNMMLYIANPILSNMF